MEGLKWRVMDILNLQDLEYLAMTLLNTLWLLDLTILFLYCRGILTIFLIEGMPRIIYFIKKETTVIFLRRG